MQWGGVRKLCLAVGTSTFGDMSLFVPPMATAEVVWRHAHPAAGGGDAGWPECRGCGRHLHLPHLVSWPLLVWKM